MKIKKYLIILILLITAVLLCGCNNTTNNIIEEVNFLDVESTGEIFYYILCNAKNLKKNNPQTIDNCNIYESANSDYNIEIISDKETDKIISIKLMSFTDDIVDCRNFFCKLTELDFSSYDDDVEIISFIVDNIGKEATKQIKNMNFELSVGTSGKPIIIINANN